jgi:rare lipoprotein A
VPLPAFPSDSQESISVNLRIFVFLVLIALATSANGEERVSASWYGDELRGNRTASGEKFNPDGFTAAHRTLPLGTCLVVGNPRNGKSVKVRVNDRGPFVKDRVLDLAAGAARAIEMVATQIITMGRC